jgi:hypothetical protein
MISRSEKNLLTQSQIDNSDINLTQAEKIKKIIHRLKLSSTKPSPRDPKRQKEKFDQNSSKRESKAITTKNPLESSRRSTALTLEIRGNKNLTNTFNNFKNKKDKDIIIPLIKKDSKISKALYDSTNDTQLLINEKKILSLSECK